jgi:hypothetical protein
VVEAQPLEDVVHAVRLDLGTDVTILKIFSAKITVEKIGVHLVKLLLVLAKI